jgi:predicted ATPase
LVNEPQPDGSPRYQLAASVRDSAQTWLDADPTAGVVRRRHAGYFADLAEQAGEGLAGRGRTAWLARVERELANLSRAFTTTMEAGNVAEAVRICTGLWPYWLDGHSIGQGRDWFDQLIARADTLRGPALVRVSHAAARLAAAQQDHEAAQRLAETGLLRAESIDDRDGAAECRSVLRRLNDMDAAIGASQAGTTGPHAIAPTAVQPAALA